MRVLVVEDEPRLAANLVGGLREAGFAVDQAEDGISGLAFAEQNVFDLVLLDLMLPLMDGKDVLMTLRRKQIQTPVIILTAKEDKESIIDLLNSGADDYLPKPFVLGELIARCKALIRRSKGAASPVIRIGKLEIDTVHQEIRRDGVAIDLSPTEFRILEYLAHRPRMVISKRELLEHLYDYDWQHHSNVIEVHMSNLRRKLTNSKTGSIIETLRQRGYRLKEEAE